MSYFISGIYMHRGHGSACKPSEPLAGSITLTSTKPGSPELRVKIEPEALDQIEKLVLPSVQALAADLSNVGAGSPASEDDEIPS